MDDSEGVDIAGRRWRFVSIRGRQLLNGEECTAMVHLDRLEVTIADTAPYDEQLAAAAAAAMHIRRKSGRWARLGWLSEDESRPRDGA